MKTYAVIAIYTGLQITTEGCGIAADTQRWWSGNAANRVVGVFDSRKDAGRMAMLLMRARDDGLKGVIIAEQFTQEQA